MSVLRTTLHVLSIVLLAMFATLASAQAPSYGPSITLDGAKKVAAAAVAEAKKNNWNVAIAIVDTGGFLVYYERIDDTQSASPLIAIEKARTSAMFRRPTKVFTDAVAKGGGGVALMGLPGVTPNTGGVPIYSGGKIVGGIGVSGVTGDQDEQIAKAGAGAL